ncbi:nucleotide pyrophosphohydrolase [Ligilactobacillus pabuli]|uniref:Nucleotide pyrophosphohydrolase n=1 Tax=Ligilactobacillus pabuli TaxID=2886039 RepID=A0ABQ5JIC9_9LACO|nr:nucleotide pyrophosphohydrolase [Ligilactobacillus pabuli]GKS81483.1 nucleotide pyrophosphohydrolase [Ligilactobacillus pabuli]HIW89530.1 nucleotide pyrophosphohydrolase [Candidatus Ligilactobacillus excrementipullorum]
MGKIHNLEQDGSNRNLQIDQQTSEQYQTVLQQLRDFRQNQGWAPFHNLKDLALSLDLEAAEVLEIFQWQSEDTPLTPEKRAHLEEELADVLTYTFFMCEQLNVDPLKLVAAKTKINNRRTWDK